MNEIQLFQSNLCNGLRVMERDGQYWFAAIDVCDTLGLTNPTKAISGLDDDEKMTVTNSRSHSGQRGGAQMINLISESGLYALIFRSRKLEAKAFRRWVTGEVLPSIRQHGMYISEQLLRDKDALIEKLNARIDAMDQEAVESSCYLSTVTCRVEMQAKLLDIYRAAEDDTDLLDIRETAQVLGVPEHAFVEGCIARKLLYRGRHGKLRAYAKGLRDGLWRAFGTGLRTTAEGREKLRIRLHLN